MQTISTIGLPTWSGPYMALGDIEMAQRNVHFIA